MIDPLLEARLKPLLGRLRQRRVAGGLALWWLSMAAMGLALRGLKQFTGWMSPWALPAMVLITIVGATWTLWHLWKTRPGLRQLASLIEGRQPELKGVLLTAIQQDESAPGGLNFLQQRVVLSALQASHQGRWRRWIPGWQMMAAHLAQMSALLLALAVIWSLRAPGTTVRTLFIPRTGLEITPGDVAMEKGSSLVVLAHFGTTPPVRADLIVATSGESERRIPLARSLADPVFGGSVPEVTADFRYRVEYDGQKTREFKVTVYEHPKLDRADADLVYPAYTGLPPQRVEDTRRVSAVEGSRLTLSLQLNKPVVSATLLGPTNVSGRPTLRLEVGTNRAVTQLRGWILTNSGRYDLVLVDVDGRTNKMPASFVLTALSNRPPEMKLLAPKGDLRPSALQEVQFSGTVWDDFGVPRYGLAFTRAGGQTEFVELGSAVPAQDKRPFEHRVRLEDMGARPDDLVSWFAWAEDIGPDGQVRRTESDMFFAEVRPFDEIFRETEAMSGEGEGQQGTPATRLAELQKQIINATWKLQRQPGTKSAYAADASVVRDAQSQALERAEGELEKAEASGRAAEWRAVIEAMKQAMDHLTQASSTPAALAPALVSEQAAYQALLRMSARETSVSRARSQSSGGGESANQRQIDQLDLKQAEDRYETQSQAQAQQKPEQREQLQVLNRLKELAQRQEDLNERMKELQTALQEARTDAERAEAKRQLKRLQEEQREMLADVDELRQRMERPENQSSMADDRQNLEQTRQEIQRAAEAAEQGETSQAVASGTRAQRELEAMRDQLQKESASQFADDLQKLRSEARDLARQQDELSRKLDSARQPGRKTLSESPERKDLVEELGRQRNLLTNLVDRATQVSQLAENAEPLLSQKLEETLRRFEQEDAGGVKQFQQDLLERGQLSQQLYEHLQETAGQGGQTLEMTAELVRQGNFPQADRAEERARSGISQFREGVERAAESVLGDDTGALRRAADELDALTAELQREMASGPARLPGTGEAQRGVTNAPTAAAGEPGRESNPQAGDPSRVDQTGRQASTGEPRLKGQEQASGTGDARQPSQKAQQGGPPSNEPQAQPGQAAQPGTQAGRGGRAEQASAPPNSPPSSPNSNQAGDNLQLLAGGGAAVERDRAGGGGGPLTGGNFAPWSDRLREVEELVDSPEMRADVAGARERARLMRSEFRRDGKKPDWAVVQLEVLKPLVEVRQRVAEELARRGSRDALVPIDRDPVPTKYTELVRRYYEELGKDR